MIARTNGCSYFVRERHWNNYRSIGLQLRRQPQINGSILHSGFLAVLILLSYHHCYCIDHTVGGFHMVVFVLSNLTPVVDAFYVSYETSTLYKVGDRVPIKVNKLTSPTTLSPIDYQSFPLCGDTTSSAKTQTQTQTKKWDKALLSLHGDALYDISLNQYIDGTSVTFGYDVYCATACSFAGIDDSTSTSAQLLQYMIQNEYSYNIYLDELPASYRSETDDTVSVTYWGGIPVGHKQKKVTQINSRYNFNSPSEVVDDSMLYLYNHWNIIVWYRPSNDVLDSYSIVRVLIEPYSVQQEYDKDGTAMAMSSCTSSNVINPPIHSGFEDLLRDEVPVQPLTYQRPVRFTYDVTWVESPDENISHKTRWNVYLTMDDWIPNYIEFAGFFLGGFLLLSVSGVLCIWVLRDLSYKPIISQQNDFEDETTNGNVDDEVISTSNSQRDNEMEKEIQMWPLSNRLFFPPVHKRLILCIACGTGAQLLCTSFSFIVLFRFGIVNQSQGAKLLTPGIVLYSLSSFCGGYVTARLYAIFHGKMIIALVASLCTAIIYPLIGIFVVYIVYDMLPNSDAPAYNISSNMSPIIILWICFVWPCTILGGYYGHKGGPIQNFPVSQGCVGYHDLNLQQIDMDDEKKINNRFIILTSCTKKYRIFILLATGGLIPILSCFVNYSVGVAGPILLGYYSVRSYAISSFIIFMLLSGVEAVLFFYRQLRTYNTCEWWWASFSTAGSAGIYIFVLSMCYIVFRGDESNVSPSSFLLYLIWFAFTSFGVLLMAGFMGVTMNIIFIRVLYIYIVNRQQ